MMMSFSWTLCLLFWCLYSGKLVSYSRKMTVRPATKTPKNSNAKLAESLYLNISDFIPEKITSNGYDVCEMPRADFLNLCTRITSSPKFEGRDQYFIVTGRETGKCEQYTAVLSYNQREPPFINVSARMCHSDPPLLLIRGHGNVSTFVLEHLYEGSPMLQFKHFA